MLTDFSPRIATTPTFEPLQGHELYKVYAAQGLIGRAIMFTGIGKKDEYDGRLFLSARTACDWCAEHRIPKKRLVQMLRQSGVLLDTRLLVSLGKGTTVRVSRQRCWVLDLNKLEPTTVEAVNGNRSEQGPLEEDNPSAESDE